MESQPQNPEFRISRENFHPRKFSYHAFQKANNKGTDQTLQTCRLVCAFVVRMQQGQVFSQQGGHMGQCTKFQY